MTAHVTTAQPTTARIHELLRYGDRLCASLYLPRSRTQPHGDQVRFRALVARARQALHARGVSAAVAEVVLAPAARLAASDAAWQGDHAPGLALFCGKDFAERFDLPLAPVELVAVGFGCHVRPFLDLPAAGERFLVLAVNKDHARLLVGDHLGLRPADVAFPAAVVEPRQHAGRDHDLQRKSMGASGASVTYGGNAHENHEHDQLRTWFRAIDHQLHDSEPTGRAPLLLAGPGHVVPLMREVMRYPRLLAAELLTNTDDLDLAGLHRRALPLVADSIAAERAAARERFASLGQDPRALSDLAAILPAAYDGRVEVLFTDRAAQAHGSYDEVARTVTRHDVAGASDDDLINLAVVATVAHGGTAHQFDREQMPAGSEAAAILRY